MKPIKSAFLLETVKLPVEKILPSRTLAPGIQSTARYKTIEASVREVGIIEPLVVYPQAGKGNLHLLLDGHVRLAVLRELGRPDVTCLVSTDDENCTYNHRVNRLAPIQEHRMIMKAIEAGVPEGRIAKALNITIDTVRRTKSRLTDISPDAIDLLKDKPVADMTLRVLKKVKPFRQIEMAELMSLSNTFTASYARALLAATPRDQLVESAKVDTRPEQLAKLENEMRAIERDFVLIEDSFGRDTMNLQMAQGYLKKMLANAKVSKHLGQKHPELLAQLQRVVEVASLDG
ncbi:plasmid partitioning protein RepB C-terminal domain-containing protein [soil metagenome]